MEGIPHLFFQRALAEKGVGQLSNLPQPFRRSGVASGIPECLMGVFAEVNDFPMTRSGHIWECIWGLALMVNESGRGA